MAVPVYESTASIRIDEDPSNVPVLDILETISTGSQVETEMEVLRSRTLAEDVVDSLALQVVLAGPRGVARAKSSSAFTSRLGHPLACIALREKATYSQASRSRPRPTWARSRSDNPPCSLA